jgi:hypothetical protein
MTGRPVKRSRDGTYTLRLSPEERELLKGLGPRMREVLVDEEDPARSRLFPLAYPEDEERQAEFRLLAGGELEESHLAALATLEETLDADRLTEEQLLAWMRALNQVRLIMGVRLDVSEDGDERVGVDDARAAAFAVYDYLTWLQGEIIDCVAR